MISCLFKKLFPSLALIVLATCESLANHLPSYKQNKQKTKNKTKQNKK